MRPVPPGWPNSDVELEGTREVGGCAAPSTLPGTASNIISTVTHFAARYRFPSPPSPLCISAVLLMEDESHAKQDGDRGRCGGRKCDRQDSGNAESLGHIAEKIDAEASESAVEHHARHTAQPREAERKARGHEHHCREHCWQDQKGIEIDLIPRCRKAGLPCGLDESGKIPERHRFGRRKTFLDARRRKRRRNLVSRVARGSAFKTAYPGILQDPGACTQHCRLRLDPAEKVVLCAIKKNDHVLESNALVGYTHG